MFEKNVSGFTFIASFVLCCIVVLTGVNTYAVTPADPGFSTGKGQLPVLDNQGREIILNGLSDGSSKHTYMRRTNETEETVEFQARVLGYNTRRYLIFWDHIMPTKGIINHDYLDDIEARLNWFSANNMHVILDMHQDNWSEACGGNGAPAWTSIGTADPAPGAPWWLTYASPCVVDSNNAFFNNQNGVMDEFVNAWGAVAARFKDHPAVIGYDLMNEPNQADAIVDQMIFEMLDDSTKNLVNFAVKTTIWIDGHPYNAFSGLIKDQIANLAADTGIAVPDSYIEKIAHVIIARTSGDWGELNAVEEFEGGPLTTMYQRVINRIRDVDQDKYLFVEPMSLSVNNGFRTRLGYLNDPGTNGRRLGYMPHMYPRSLHEGGAYGEADYSIVDEWEKVSRDFVYENNMAFLLGEFGHSNAAVNGVQYLKDAVRMAENNKLGWEYWDSGTGWGPYNNDTMELQNNAEALINIYPRAVAGRIENVTYNREEKTFVLSYRNHEGVTGNTEISIPSGVFEDGFIVSSTDADTTWSYVFDASHSILQVTHNPNVLNHTITIKPSALVKVAVYRELIDLRAGKCLDFSGRIPAAGKNIVIWDLAGKTWQRWAYDEANQFIRNYQNPDLCLTHYGPSEAKNGGAVSLAPCTDSDDIRWIMEKHDDGYSIRNSYDPTFVLDAFGTNNGSAVGQWTSHNGPNQRWKWGWKNSNASMISIVSAMEAGHAYDMKIWAKANGCALEWDAHADRNNERNAKFDSSTYGDSMTFNADTTPIVNPNGSLSVSGYFYTYNRACGLEWDSSVSNGERNAKFDCSGSADPVTITTAGMGTSVLISSGGCGLEWDYYQDNNGERNTKWDCSPSYDGLKLIQVEPLH